MAEYPLDRATPASRHHQDWCPSAVINAPIPVMLHAEDGEVLQISRTWTEITGYSLAEIPTIAAWTEKAYGQQQNRICRKINRLYRLQQHVKEGEFHIKTHSGDIRVWEFYSSPLGSLPDGRRLVNSSAVDITDRKRVETELHQSAVLTELRSALIDLENRAAQLEQVNADLEAFAHTVAHDLSAPLRGIQGFTQALLNDNASGSLAPDYLRRIAVTAERMDALICDLLILNRINRLDLTIKPINLDSVVREVLETLSIVIQPAQIEVAEPLGIVWGNRTLLVQTISNLLTNAVKFVAPGTIPNIYLKTEDCPAMDMKRWLRLSVEDNGIGISPADQDRIFAPFERLQGSDFYAGTGLGLAIVHRAIERMGGRVGVESQLGNGSRFWVELPQFADEGAATRETPRANSAD